MNTRPIPILFRRAAPADYPGMLRLQAGNLIGNLSDEEARDGFLMIEYTAEQFDEINRDVGVSVAIQGREVVGYLCATTFRYGSRYPILDALIRRLRDRSIDGVPVTDATTFIYGPVCVSRGMRGSGVLAGLLRAIEDLAQPRFRQCVLFVSDRNPRSLHAHVRKLGMQDLGPFLFEGKQFHLVGTILGRENGGRS